MAEAALPKLRESLSIYPEDGQKGDAKHWLIYDNVVHRFYQIGYLEYLILSLWHLADKDKIIQSLQQIHKKTLSSQHFEEFFQFLVSSKLLQNSKYTSMMDAKKKGLSSIHQIQKMYFFKIHLLRPEKILNTISPYCGWLFSRKFHFIMMCVILLGIVGVIQNFEMYKTTFVSFFNLGDIWLWVASVAIVKIIHEFAHAITSKYYGCTVSSMGVAILVFWPVLFTDTTHAWSLGNRRKRIFISAAGVISEMYIAAICSILWLFIPDGTIKSVAFILSTTALAASLLINANPFMRFDGYFVLSDIMKVPNLHQAAGYYRDKYFDEHVLGVVGAKNLPHIRKSIRPKLAFFGLLMWFYRLSLISVMLWLIYSHVFKLLAIFLMGMYIVSAVLMPLYRKVKYLSSKKVQKFNRKTLVRTNIAVLVLLFLVLFPWRSSIEVPAIMHFEDSSVMYASDDSVVDSIFVTQGEYVKKDDILMVLKSQRIEYDLQDVKFEHEILTLKLKAASVSEEYKSDMQTILKEIDEKVSQYNSIKKKKGFLVIKAPHDGIVYFPNFNVEKNDAFAKNQEVLSIANPEKRVVTGYIPEDVVGYFEQKKDAMFYPEGLTFKVTPVSVSSVSFVGVKELDQPYLASVYGGDILVKKQGDTGKEILVPEKGIYSIKASVKKVDSDEKRFLLIVRGVMVLKSKRYSLSKSFFDFVYSGFLKHSSF